MSESRVVEQFLSTRTESSFIALFETLYPKMICFFVVRGMQQSVAEELAQDVLTAVYRHSSALRGRQFFFGWIFRIARNFLLQHLRKHRREMNTVSIDDVGEKLAHDDLNANLEFHDSLRCLDHEEQQIMLLRYVEELSYQEIAMVLGIPLGTVKWKIFNAKSKLTEMVRGR